MQRLFTMILTTIYTFKSNRFNFEKKHDILISKDLSPWFVMTVTFENECYNMFVHNITTLLHVHNRYLYFFV